MVIVHPDLKEVIPLLPNHSNREAFLPAIIDDRIAINWVPYVDDVPSGNWTCHPVCWVRILPSGYVAAERPLGSPQNL